MEDKNADDIENINLYPDIFERENNPQFEIIKNILVGKTTSICEERLNKPTRRHIGNYILNRFKVDPSFIGQIDAETGQQTTFEEMRQKSVKCALWLKNQGIHRNNVITVCTMNQLNAYVPFFAGLYIGCKVNLLDEYLVKGNVNYFLKKIKPRIIFASASFAMTILLSCEVKGKCNSLPKIVAFDYHEAFESLDSILNYRFNEAAVDYFSCSTLKISETAIILFSSGTDSLPKDVDIPYSVFMAPPYQQAPFMHRNDIAIWFESFGFITGMFLTIRAAVSYVTVVIAKPIFHTEKACKLIEKYKVTWMFLKTDMCAELVKFLDLTKYNVNMSSLKNVLFGGSVVNHEIHANLIKLLPNASIIQVYNLTETGIIVYQRKNGKIGSSGYVGRNIQLMITSLYSSDIKETPLGPNIQGQIWCRSPYMMRKYYGDKSDINYCEKTSWFQTGDVGYYDEDGNIFVIERISQIFKYKKMIISPVEIENVLQNHPAVLKAVVVPVPYTLEDKCPKAFIMKVPGKEATEEEIEQWVIEKLGPNKELRGGVIFLSRMPCISNGKIQRKIFNYWAQVDIYNATYA